MDILEAAAKRNSVRNYIDKAIDPEAESALRAEIEQCNSESGLNIRLVTDEPRAFKGLMAHYGKFSGVKNYIVMAGARDDVKDEKIGYYGERIVLKAQTLSLNTCWVAATFSKRTVRRMLDMGEKLVCVIALGYGETQGRRHMSKPIEAFYGDSCRREASCSGLPEWFKNGVKAAALAPTAVNQQKFEFGISADGRVTARSLGGFYSKVDLGIVRYHFEIGAGIENFEWAEML